jgi:hypothetical protein
MLYELIRSCKDAYQYLTPLYAARPPPVSDTVWTVIASKMQQTIVQANLPANNCRIQRYGARAAATKLVDFVNEGRFSFGEWPRETGEHAHAFFLATACEHASLAYHANACGCVLPGNMQDKPAVQGVIVGLNALRHAEPAAAAKTLEQLTEHVKSVGHLLFRCYGKDKLGAFARLEGYEAVQFLAQACSSAPGLHDTA